MHKPLTVSRFAVEGADESDQWLNPVDGDVAALSAAHILDYSQSACQETWNGILLRADLHLLFDRHLLRIFPGNPPVAVLDNAIQESEAYKLFHLHPLQPPNPFDERTNEELRRRWEAANQAFRHFDPPSG